MTPIDDPPPVDWNDLEARLLVYSSPAVIGKLRAASDAERQLAAAWRDGTGFRARETVQQAGREARVADGLDDEPVDTIRAELHASTDRTPMPPVPLAATAQNRV